MITSTAGYIPIFSAMRMLGAKVSRVLVGISAIALACFGLYQLWMGISGMTAIY